MKTIHFNYHHPQNISTDSTYSSRKLVRTNKNGQHLIQVYVSESNFPALYSLPLSWCDYSCCDRLITAIWGSVKKSESESMTMLYIDLPSSSWDCLTMQIDGRLWMDAVYSNKKPVCLRCKSDFTQHEMIWLSKLILRSSWSLHRALHYQHTAVNHYRWLSKESLAWKYLHDVTLGFLQIHISS